MPARGRHRRHRPGTVSRTSWKVTAGGAGLALPLVGAGTAAHAADGAEPVAQPQSPATTRLADRPTARETAQAVTDRAAKADRARRAGAGAQRQGEESSYEVVSGDSLSSIAGAHEVDGGWQALYERNRRTVGQDPDLIFPGQRLSLAGRALPAAPAPRSGPSTREEQRPERAGQGRGRTTADTREKDRTREREQDREKDQEKGGEQHREKDRERRRAGRGGQGPASPAGSAPVSGTGPGTPYRASGSSWSSGYHTGVDFPVATGTSVRAVSDGRIVSAGWGGAYGYQVVLRHADGRYSQYAHLSAISVRHGQRVTAGQRLGRSGSTGNSTGPHLHFEVRTGPGYGTDVDPLAYLRGLGIRL